MKCRSLTIRLDDVLEQELEAACADTGLSRCEIVRDALRRQLQLMRFERLRRRALLCEHPVAPMPARPAGLGLVDADDEWVVPCRPRQCWERLRLGT